MEQPGPVVGAALWGDTERAARSAEMIKAICHPTRLRIVALLCGGPAHVSGIAERLGRKQSIISQQLRILRMNKLVASERRRGFTFYRLAEPHLEELIRCVESCRPR